MTINWLIFTKPFLLSKRIMGVGLLLASCAWLMQMSPILSALWLEHPTFGHGICVELAPVIQSDPTQLSSSTDTMVMPDGTVMSMAEHQHHHQLIHKDKQSIPKHHDCDICLALMAFALLPSLPPLVLILKLLFTQLLSVRLRQFRCRDLDFLRPLTRAPPILT